VLGHTCPAFSQEQISKSKTLARQIKELEQNTGQIKFKKTNKVNND